MNDFKQTLMFSSYGGLTLVKACDATLHENASVNGTCNAAYRHQNLSPPGDGYRSVAY